MSKQGARATHAGGERAQIRRWNLSAVERFKRIADRTICAAVNEALQLACEEDDKFFVFDFRDPPAILFKLGISDGETEGPEFRLPLNDAVDWALEWIEEEDEERLTQFERLADQLSTMAERLRHGASNARAQLIKKP